MTNEKSDILKKLLLIICLISIILNGIVFASEWDISENAVFYEDGNETMFDDAISSLAETMGKTKRYYRSRLIVKDPEEMLDGIFDSVYPGTAMKFDNNEIYCLRGVSSQTKDDKILFIVKAKNDVSLVYPRINYNKYPNGIYDPCITPYIDGKQFFLSGYTFDENEEFVSVLMVLDDNFNVVSETKVPGAKFSGNTLVTSQGFILHLSCEDGLSLYRSTNPFKNSLENMNISNIGKLDSSEIDNATMGYSNNKIVALYNDSENKLKYTFIKNQEGVGKWNISKTISQDYINPVMQYKSSSNEIVFSCTALSEDRTYPVIGYFDIAKESIKDIYDFDNKLYGIAGFPSFLVHNDGYGCMYFDNIGEDDCAVYIKDIKSNFKDSIPQGLELSSNEAELFLSSMPYEKGTSVGLCGKSNIFIDYNKKDNKISVKYNYQKYIKHEFSLNSKSDLYKMSDEDLDNITILAKLCGYSLNYNYDGMILGKDGKYFNIRLNEKDGLYSDKQIDNIVAYLLKETFNEIVPTSFEGCQKIGHNSNGVIYVGYKVENSYAIKAMASAEKSNISKVTYSIDGQAEVLTEPLMNIRTPHDRTAHNIVITAYGANGIKVQTTYNYK